MDNLLKTDNFLLNLMGKIGDLIYLNFLWIVLSLPIFTIGASTTALYYVTLKMCNGVDTNITKNFFSSFKSNFKQSTYSLILFFTAGLIILISFYYWSTCQSIIGYIFSLILFCITLIFIMVIFLFFPMLAKFQNTIPMLLKNSLIVCIKYILPSFTPILLLIISTILILKFHIAIFMSLLLGVSLFAQINSYVYNDIFNKLIDN